MVPVSRLAMKCMTCFSSTAARAVSTPTISASSTVKFFWLILALRHSMNLSYELRAFTLSRLNALIFI